MEFLFKKSYKNEKNRNTIILNVSIVYLKLVWCTEENKYLNLNIYLNFLRTSDFN